MLTKQQKISTPLGLHFTFILSRNINFWHSQKPDKCYFGWANIKHIRNFADEWRWIAMKNGHKMPLICCENDAPTTKDTGDRLNMVFGAHNEPTTCVDDSNISKSYIIYPSGLSIDCQWRDTRCCCSTTSFSANHHHYSTRKLSSSLHTFCCCCSQHSYYAQRVFNA